MSSLLVNRIGAFTAVPNAFIRATEEIDNEAFRLFIVLLMHAGAQADGVAFPAYDTLMKETTLKSRSTISTRLHELEALGWVSRQRRFGKSTVYSLQVPARLMHKPSHVSSPPGGLSVVHGVDYQKSTGWTISSPRHKTLIRTNQKEPIGGDGGGAAQALKIIRLKTLLEECGVKGKSRTLLIARMLHVKDEDAFEQIVWESDKVVQEAGAGARIRSVTGLLISRLGDWCTDKTGCDVVEEQALAVVRATIARHEKKETHHDTK